MSTNQLGLLQLLCNSLQIWLGRKRRLATLEENGSPSTGRREQDLQSEAVEEWIQVQEVAEEARPPENC